MPRRSSRRKRNEEEEVEVKETPPPRRKKAKIEEEKKEEMKMEEDDDFDLDGLLESLSTPKKDTKKKSPGKKEMADSTQDDFIKMLQDFKKEEKMLQEARLSYQKGEEQSMDVQEESLDDIEGMLTSNKFVLTPPILFDSERDKCVSRCDLNQVINQNNINYKTILENHPYFIDFDTQIIPVPSQQDLVASGFMQSILSLNPTNSIPPFIFDWLFSLVCFSPNRSIPGTAFRTIASITSSLPFSVEIDTLSPDLSIIDSFDEQTECFWGVSFSTFVDILILYGANSEKLGREKEGGDDDENDSNENMAHGDEEGGKAKGKGEEGGGGNSQPTFSPLQRYQLNLFLQLTGLTITAKKFKKDASDLPKFLRACAMLLLDPIGQHAQGPILYTILRVLHAFPKFSEEECLSICREILSKTIFPHHQHWVKLAQFLPITTRRAKLLKNSVAYCGVCLLAMGSLPSSLFQSSLPVHGKNGTLELFYAMERRYSPSSLNNDGKDYDSLAREFLSVLELFDLCLDKKEVVVMAGTKKREKVLEDYRTLTNSMDSFRQTIHDDLSSPEKMFVKEVLARISQTLGDLLEYLGFEAKRKAGLKQPQITDLFKS